MKTEATQKKSKLPKIILICLLVIIAVFIAVCAYWHEATYAVFKNVTVKKYKLAEPDSWDGGEAMMKIPYAEDSDSQYLDLYMPKMPEGEKPQLYVIIHGGGFISNDSESRQARLMYDYFRDHGYACASINYRLAPEAEFPGALADCKAAIRFLKAHADEYGYNAERVPVFGESAGGYLAVMCGVTPDDAFSTVNFIGQEDAPDVTADVDVVVDYYGHVDNRGAEDDWAKLRIPKFIRSIANAWVSGEKAGGYEDVESYWFRKNVSEMTEEEYTERDPHAWIDKTDISQKAFLIYHGDCDITVPYYQSVRLYEHVGEKIDADKLEYELMPGMGHASDPMYSEEQLAKVEEFLKKVL